MKELEVSSSFPAIFPSQALVLSVLFGLWIIVTISASSVYALEGDLDRESDAGNCQKFENTLPLCFFSNPEDMAVVQGDNVLIVSEYGDHHGTQPGALVLYDYQQQQHRNSYAGSDFTKPKQYWGEASCTEPPGKLFSPHGIDLSQRADGHWQLLVVQHGGRESVEFFEVAGAGEHLRLVWRGCVVAPENARLNSVAAGSDDEFFTTKMLSIDSSWQREQADTRQPTGLVYRWSEQSGFEPVTESEGVMLNGIAASKDGSEIYVVYSGESLVKKIDARGGGVLGSTTIKSADNIKWSADGKTLIVASFVGSESSEEFVNCSSPDRGICPIAFAIIQLDPDTLENTTLFQNVDAPMGAGTVGLKVDSILFVGTFSGNRILQVDLRNPVE